MALGDYKRTSRDNKTISIAQPNEALRSPRTKERGDVSENELRGKNGASPVFF
ncbi:hypothetical protein H6G25_16115 [Dolichospermum sp. FACHB-1091]|uniref:hypothetical protein n=1 Tax=Dolichospermum sp. FACHB-1091 TaxID=2692798 RepID=UPI001681B45A|nr:hypothetical protein [Dolichospermum sp. FACHB-1091]MBD2444684.1 hypothetical protein [Dolichospermum sp. FACHB-1091]